MTRLDRLIESIHPQRLSEETARRADAALATFSAPAARIADWESFRSCITAFVRHVEKSILRLSGECRADREFEWERCVRFLMRAYGPSGEKAAFEMARTGIEGGLHGVLKAVAGTLAEEYTRTETRARIHTFWNGLTAEEQWNVADEYIEKYGRLLPSELTEGSAGRIRASVPAALERHAEMLQRLGRVGR